MKYGFNLLLWTGDVTETHRGVLEMLKGFGYDGVELPLFDADVAKGKRTGAMLDGLGLERTAVSIATPEANPIDASPAVRQAAVDRLKGVVDVCHAAGVKLLCGPLHSALGQFSGSGRTADEWSRGKETILEVADHARAAGVTLVMEYLNRFECYFLNCAADCAQFCQEINHPNVRMMYDTFHANIEEKNIADAIRTAAPYMVHVHISENDRSTPGEGHVDWATSFKTLKEVQYDGWLMIEAFGLALPELAAATRIWRRMFPSEEHLAKNGLAFMKKNWNG
jgi:D-psicose/D-tagatose/L-ribulose 3-epimerase